jgi:hypothetical protein
MHFSNRTLANDSDAFWTAQGGKLCKNGSFVLFTANAGEF